MKNNLIKLGLAVVLATMIAGCTTTNTDEDTSPTVTPTRPTLSNIVQSTPTPTPKPTAMVPDDFDDSIETTKTPTPSISPTKSPTSNQQMDYVEGKITVTSAEIISASSKTGFVVNVQGLYEDNCTLPNYKWSLSGNTVEIDLGKLDESVDECKEAQRDYAKDIGIEFSGFKDGEEYTAKINGYETEAVTYTEE